MSYTFKNTSNSSSKYQTAGSPASTGYFGSRQETPTAVSKLYRGSLERASPFLTPKYPKSDDRYSSPVKTARSLAHIDSDLNPKADTSRSHLKTSSSYFSKAATPSVIYIYPSIDILILFL